MRRTIQLPFLAPFSLTDGVVISSDAICLRKVGHRYLAEVHHSCGSTQDVVGKEIVVGSTPEGIWPGPQTSETVEKLTCKNLAYIWIAPGSSTNDFLGSTR